MEDETKTNEPGFKNKQVRKRKKKKEEKWINKKKKKKPSTNSEALSYGNHPINPQRY